MAVQIHLRRPEPAVVAPPARGWKLAGPLEGWRDDDPDALLRCSINSEHMIRNGDRYAVSVGGIKMACLTCAQVSPPIVVAPPPTHPRPAAPALTPNRAPEIRTCARDGCEETFTVTALNRTRRYCSPECSPKSQSRPVPRPNDTYKISAEATSPPGEGAVGHPATTATGPASEPPPAKLMTGSELIGDWPAPAVEAPAFIPSERPRVCLGPAHPDYGAPTQETAPRHNPIVFAGPDAPSRKRQASPRPPVRVVAVEASVCETCGSEHQPIAVRPRHCSWACVWRAAVSPTPHGVGCLCLACADGRLVLRVPPLIGLSTAREAAS